MFPIETSIYAGFPSQRRSSERPGTQLNQQNNAQILEVYVVKQFLNKQTSPIWMDYGHICPVLG
jgi:hypothetical protein